MPKWREGQSLHAFEYPVGGFVYDTREKAKRTATQWVVAGEIRVYDARIAQKSLAKRAIDYGLGRIFYSVFLDEKAGRINDIFLFEEARHRGVGYELVKMAERRMKGWGAEKISGSSSREAVEFWKKMGYELKGYSEIQKTL